MFRCWTRVPKIYIFVAILLANAFISYWMYWIFSDDNRSTTVYGNFYYASPEPITDYQDEFADEIWRSVLETKWIEYFPHLKVLISKQFPISNETDAKKTEILSQKDQIYRVGGHLEAAIIAKDGSGNQKQYGGDYFIATLRPKSRPKDGVSCPVTDNMDGTYTITCILPFGGDAELQVTMLHPSESILKLIATYSSTNEYGSRLRTKTRNSKNVFEYADCSVGFPNKRREELCNYTNPTHGEPYWCLKPPSGECNPLLEQEMLPNMNQLKFFDRRYFVKERNYKVHVGVINVHIVMSPSSSDPYMINDVAKWSLNPMEATGWFHEANWVSRKVKVQPYSVERLKKCFRGHDIYFIGDSTVRQWYSYFVTQMKLKSLLHGTQKEGWSQPRDCSSAEDNFTLHFRPPGPPFHNNLEIWPFITDRLDRVPKTNRKIVIIFTAGFHYLLFTPDVFLDRITRIKHAIVSLLDRIPGSKVIIKGIHYHEPRPPFVISPWKTQVFEVIMRNVFREVANVSYFETWDFMLTGGNILVHPEDDLLMKVVGVLMSYIS